jgi:hypothetical protein
MPSASSPCLNTFYLGQDMHDGALTPFALPEQKHPLSGLKYSFLEAI